MPQVREHTEELDGIPVFWRAADVPAGVAPPLYVHGVPTSSDDWVPFLERGGGIAVDLPGFGRSGKRGDWDYSIAGYERFLAHFLDHVGIDRYALAVHDWGAVGLALAQRAPERVARLAVTNCVPLLPGYRWHPIARAWRTPALGELLMGLTTRWVARRLSGLPREYVDGFWPHFDQGTQRAILRLYRSAPEPALEAAGARLGTLAAPALVLWGERDPFIPPAFADAYARALPAAELVRVPDAGHWWWLGRPDLIDRVAGFLLAG